MRRFTGQIGITLLALLASSQISFAHSAGAPAGVSGAPGDGLCTDCHVTNPVANSGKGSLVVTFANGTSYTPGQTQRVKVTISDPQAARWGFEASPRAASSPDNTGAGKLATVDGNTQVYPPSGTLDWITHTSPGTRRGTTGSATFEFDWTAPATDIGDVTFYVASNAANNNGSSSGDFIYSTKVTLSAAAAAQGPKPTISDNGVTNGASFTPGVTAGSWVTITGANLASSTRIWDPSKEIVNGKLPTSLDGTSVTINGKPAAVYFISPTQLNVQAPDDDSTGPVNVVVTNANGASAPITAQLQKFSPALFLFDPQGRKYPAATSGDGKEYLGPNALFGTALTTRPAKPGETITLYGTGFGPTNPLVTSGQLFQGAPPCTNNPVITIGGIQAQVLFAGLSSPGLYQFNVVVPQSVGDGDQKLQISVGGLQSPDNVFLAVKR